MSQHEKGPPNRRDSTGSSSGSPFRQRRSSLSIANPPNPSLPLAAAASINASMRGGSPGPETTAKDSVASRRSSVANELALADDSLPPPAEIAVGDRKNQIPDVQGASTGRIPSISTHGGSTGSLSVNPAHGGHGSRTGSISSSPIDPFRTGALRDPFAGAPTDGQPGHQRTPSISQVHQEMEQEQEAQVNRLLVTIHQQQTLIEKLQRQLEGGPHMDTIPSTDLGSEHHGVMPERLPSGSSTLGTATPGLDYPPPPTPQRAHSSSSAGTTVASTMPAGRASPTFSSSTSGRVSAMHMALSHQSQRAASSRSSSRAGSPAPRVTRRLGHGDDDPGKAASLDSGNVVKENELLKARIQELEAQLSGLRAGSSAATSSQMDTST